MDAPIADPKIHSVKDPDKLMKNFDPDLDVIDHRILFEITGRE